MSHIDHKGTTPGLVGHAVEQQTIHMKCKNQNCDSINAVEIALPNQSHQRVYKCVKCHRSWGASVGGAVNF